MIPISRDQRLTKEIDGVVYSFLPPVGDLEIELIFNRSTEDMVDTSKYYDEAVKILKEGGKKRPSDNQIKDQIMLMLPKENTGMKQAKEMNELIDRVCVGWESKEHLLPEFCAGDCAADMCFSLKNAIYAWYWDQIHLGEKEVKN